jgi:hypothetical protein
MRIKTIIRHALALVGGFLAGTRLIDAVKDWRQWHEWAVVDPSAADLYRTNFWLDVTFAIAIVGITALISRLLRPNVRGG